MNFERYPVLSIVKYRPQSETLNFSRHGARQFLNKMKFSRAFIVSGLIPYKFRRV
jgi:hypothetical protein